MVLASAVWIWRSTTRSGVLRVAPSEPGAEYRFKELNPDGQPVAWSWCNPLHYTVNPTNAPPGGVNAVRKAAEMVAKATGLEIVFDGTTDTPHDPTNTWHDPYQDRWRPLAVSWVIGDGAGLQFDDAIAFTKMKSVIYDQEKGQSLLVSGFIVFDVTAGVSPGFGPGLSLGKVALHEFGHAVGLDHVDDPNQVMFEGGRQAPAALGPGDLAGLRAAGHAQPKCVRAPSPSEAPGYGPVTFHPPP